MRLPTVALRFALALGLLASYADAQESFVHWETPHVHPLELTPDGARLLAVNTADNRLEVFDLASDVPVASAAIPVGLDPVSVRARTASEAWVVNHVSDSVSVVDLATGNVVATLDTDDEPADVVFAGDPGRAYVSCSQANTVLVFDPDDLATAPTTIPVLGEDPRAMAVSPAGDRVYVAVFESGNQSTVLGGGSTRAGGFPANVVDHPQSPHEGRNPPPNDGDAFTPPISASLPEPPNVSLIVKRDASGTWLDDNGGDWTSFVNGPDAMESGRPVGWELLDHDVAVIDAGDLSVTYVDHLMNTCMALGVQPVQGNVMVVGTDGTNEIRYEPNLKGTFLRVQLALIDPAAPSTPSVQDLNDHLTYAVSSIAQTERDMSLGDPRGIAWNALGTRAYVTGLGSNNLVVLDALGNRAGLAPTIEVGEGPTGLAVDDARSQLYVLNKFEASLSVVSTSSETEIARVSFFDPTPEAIRTGRKHLYDTHETSGLGLVSCASCHVDARMDRLAWDLGDPGGAMKSLQGQNLGAGIPGLAALFEDFHPMKGPMLTQTLQDIIGKEPHHWRGDKDGLEEFNGAFLGLLGDDETLTATEMQEFEDFLATIHFPPNPFRELDNSLPTNLPLPGHFTTGRFGPVGVPLPNGDAQHGLELYRPPNLLDAGASACVTCHTLPTGMGTDFELIGAQFEPLLPGPLGERHHALVSVDGATNLALKVPQLRNLYERVGYDTTQTVNMAGYGFLHDGAMDSLSRFLTEPVFNTASDQEVADLLAFLLSFSGSDLPLGSVTDDQEPPGPLSQDTHAAVGRQATLVDGAAPESAKIALVDQMIALADAGAVGLVVKGRRAGESRGWTYVGPREAPLETGRVPAPAGEGQFQSDRAEERIGRAALLAAAGAKDELTFTVVVAGTEERIGIDRDADGFYDRDELDGGSDPADPKSILCGAPVPAAPADLVVTGVTETSITLAWTDAALTEENYLLERRLQGEGPVFELVAVLGTDASFHTDAGLRCGKTYEYRLRATNCTGASATVEIEASPKPCNKVREL